MGDCVYIVTAGDYSDYQIQSVFTTEEKAQGYIDACTRRRSDIEVWKLDDWTDEIEHGLKSYAVSMRKNGDVHSAEIWEPLGREFSQRLGVVFPDRDLFETYMWARDREHAIKIANERRAIVIATNRWKKGRITNE